MNFVASQRAVEIIQASTDRIARSDSPDVQRHRVTGEIDMAYKLDLITYAERDKLIITVNGASSARRKQLHESRKAGSRK